MNQPFLNDADFFKSINLNERGQLDLVKAAGGHKYIKRTGASGSYRYWYKNPQTGKLEEGKKPGEVKAEAKPAKEAHRAWKNEVLNELAEDLDRFGGDFADWSEHGGLTNPSVTVDELLSQGKKKFGMSEKSMKSFMKDAMNRVEAYSKA